MESKVKEGSDEPSLNHVLLQEGFELDTLLQKKTGSKGPTWEAAEAGEKAGIGTKGVLGDVYIYIYMNIFIYVHLYIYIFIYT